jgi:hypothetical protein
MGRAEKEERIMTDWWRAGNIRGYDGTPVPELIARETNPWIEVDGRPVNWMSRQAPSGNLECDTCTWSPVPGVLEAMDTPEGVQRCDMCELFDGDLDAALALARTVNGTVRFFFEP